MKLSDKQCAFAFVMTEFELWVGARWKYVRGEAFRSRPEARRLAGLGLGILDSCHCLKLAQDLIIFDENGDPWNDEVYRQAAEKWITMHPDARAGYFFESNGRGPGRDGLHFSFIHNGRQ